jgi:hypothetical protein
VTARPRRRDPYTRTVVRLPERDIADSILQLAAPLLEPLGPTPPSDDVRHAIELAVSVWNAHVAASQLWGDPRPKALSELRKAMCGKQARTGAAEAFELLSDRWRAEFSLDPRFVEAWSFEANSGGDHRLVCEMALPHGVEAEVPPPVEKRIAIDGQYLDEVRVRQGATSFLSFPVESHRGEVGSDGVATIQAKMPTALQLFADGHVLRVGGAPVEVTIGGKPLGPMVLSEVRCASNGAYHDVAVLVFRQATGAAKSRE